MPDSIVNDVQDLFPMLGKPVWVQVGGYAKPEPSADDYDEGILTTVLADDMGLWAIVRWDEGVSLDPDRIVVRFPWFRVHTTIPAVVDEAIHGTEASWDGYPDDGYGYDPDSEYANRGYSWSPGDGWTV